MPRTSNSPKEDNGTVGRSEVGRQLEQSRTSRGWSLRQAEKVSGVSNGYISQIERGEVEPSPDVLRRLGAAYGIPYEVLMEAAGYITKRSKPREGAVPAFVFSAAESMDERDWDAAQAFFQALLSIKQKNRG
jgi:transcriptional regulator with XRE-family HTH domain